MSETDHISALLPKLGSKLKKVPLATLPTPVRTVEVSLAPGNRSLAIKCDDQSGTIYGGNKVRKLEYAFGPARARNRKQIATFGAVGSNHALATAMYARSLGYPCTCFLSHQAASAGIARTLNAHLAIDTNIVRFGGAYANRLSVLRRNLQNGNFWVIPAGGSSWLGTIGFVNAALELATQIDKGELTKPDRIYIATGTMGSAAGLAIGLALAGLHCQVEAVRVSMTSICNETLLSAFVRKTLAMMNHLDASVSPDLAKKVNIRLRNSFIAGGYAHTDKETDQALRFARQQLGLDLESTYTGKAMAAILHDFEQGADEQVLFWNTYNSVPIAAVPDDPPIDRLPQEFHKYMQQTADHARQPATGRKS